jgi:hypothetical protein
MHLPRLRTGHIPRVQGVLGLEYTRVYIPGVDTSPSRVGGMGFDLRGLDVPWAGDPCLNSWYYHVLYARVLVRVVEDSCGALPSLGVLPANT